ncbi:M24 family metallopeptidase [Steroidobacter sp.]|uniref:M24 family metallopeptidase n=1 Tax=Steroidobacter sp. TaxID=1978227 RepID=UPI001A44EB16|nr:Xaa-Pro peptidase family protein [Steroidobacter sp.]MBL8269852.1 aminopeptidase P family protein [Steroidobacter sp.]
MPSTQTLPLAFDVPEFRARLAAVQARMARAKVEALFVISESNISYLTGYQGNSAYIPQGMLVTLQNPEPILILRQMDVWCATATTWLSSANIVAYGERVLGLSLLPVWQEIGRLIRARTGTKHIAVERNGPGLGVDAHAALVDGLGDVALSNADGWFSEIRAVKSAVELKRMTEAARIGEQALLAGIERIAVGTSESEVGATIVGKLCSGLPGTAGSAPIAAVTMPVTPFANAPHLNWSDRVYARGSQTNFELGAFRYRYCAAVSRTVYLGSPPPRLREIDAVVRDAFEATLPAVRTGARCCDVYDTFWKHFDGRGVRKESRIGYGIGIDWTEGSYSLQREDQRELRADSTLHLILGIWEPEEGYVFSETLRVTDSGAQSFCSLPRQLYVID